MKAFRLIGRALLAVLVTTSLAACGEDYDDSALTDRVNDLEDRVTQLEELCRQMNTNISSLQTLVMALEENDYVTNVAPVTKEGKEIGYTISFTKSKPVTIYHGKNGTDGTDGANGTDGVAPVVGVSKDVDGVYYWTLNGEWLLDNDGNKVKTTGADGQDGVNGADGQDGVNGADGITPQLKVENGFWFVSYDEGTGWTKLGAATVTVGETFKEVSVNENTVTFTLGDDTSFTLSRYKAVSIAFDRQEQGISAGAIVRIPYTLEGATDKTVVSASSDGNYKVKLENQTSGGGVVTVSAPNPYVDGYITVLVSDGNGYTSLHVIRFYEWKISISSSDEPITYGMLADGGNVSVPLDINFDYDVVIPTDATGWVSVTVEGRAAERHESLLFVIKPNRTDAARGCTIFLVPKNGTEALVEFKILQRSRAETQLEKVFTCKLPQQVDDMCFNYSNGFLHSIKTSDAIVTYDYFSAPAERRTAGQHVKIVERRKSGELLILDMEIGSNGFVKHCDETYNGTNKDSNGDTWDFEYTPEGYISKMIRSEGSNEVTTITYDENGDITHTSTTSQSGNPKDNREYDISYITSDPNTPLDNKGCLMLFDETLGIDMDEMKFAYYAGLLGKAIKHLPMKIVGHDNYSSWTDCFIWHFNANSYPVLLESSDKPIYFSWPQ